MRRGEDGVILAGTRLDSTSRQPHEPRERCPPRGCRTGRCLSPLCGEHFCARIAEHLWRADTVGTLLKRHLGIWDTDELYDLQNDPHETKNLILDPGYAAVVSTKRRELYKQLRASDGMSIPLAEKRGAGANLRRAEGSKAADFPAEVLRKGDSR